MEMLERRGGYRVVATVAAFLIVFWMQCPGVASKRNTTKMYYVCPPDFIRLGSSCYYFSETKATWPNALFACKDRDGNLTAPARWEDRHLRNYLNQPEIKRSERWIGGIYDYSARAWKWGGEMREMRYQSFSRMKRLSPQQLQWHCIAMMPDLLYRWAPKSCVEPRLYVCQTRLRKVKKDKLNELRNRWQNNGKMNEVPVTASANDDTLDLPASHSFKNDVVTVNPKSLDLRPSEYRKRDSPSPNARRRLKRPFPGYVYNRSNPEKAYERNRETLLSGRTGLTQAQVQYHLRRLERNRRRQMARRKRKHRGNGDWLSNEVPRARRLEAARHETYTVDNSISALHPKTIVEVHAFDDFARPPAAAAAAASAADNKL